MRIGKISQLLSPGYSACGKCHTTWRFVKDHTTPYSQMGAMFPLCEQCWHELTPDERLPFYRDLWDLWNSYSFPDYIPPPWSDIEAAVLAGK